MYCNLHVMFVIMSNELACFEVALALVIQASMVIFMFSFVCDKVIKIYINLSVLCCIKLQLKSQLSVKLQNQADLPTHISSV